jgi:hypothetical protein
MAKTNAVKTKLNFANVVKKPWKNGAAWAKERPALIPKK